VVLGRIFLSTACASQYLQERLVRLGIPLLFFGFLLGPLTVALAGAAQGNPIGERWMSLLSRATFVIGPLWFAWALLLFACGFALWRSGQSESAQNVSRALPTSRQWLLAALAVGAVALALRQIVPVGENVLGLQLGYFSSYVFLFALGCAASRYRWLERLERQQAMR
jgi:Acyltransferase family